MSTPCQVDIALTSRWLAPGPLVKHLYRGRVVARWWPAQGRFECRKPFDLLLSRPDAAPEPTSPPCPPSAP